MRKWRKICADCGKEFVTEYRGYYLCRECYHRQIGYVPPTPCAAVKADGQPCRAYVVQGERFCNAHLKAGYGLFDLAVEERRQLCQ